MIKENQYEKLKKLVKNLRGNYLDILINLFNFINI